jgi:hypothetical protein
MLLNLHYFKAMDAEQGEETLYIVTKRRTYSRSNWVVLKAALKSTMFFMHAICMSHKTLRLQA